MITKSRHQNFIALFDIKTNKNNFSFRLLKTYFYYQSLILKCKRKNSQIVMLIILKLELFCNEFSEAIFLNFSCYGLQVTKKQK